MRRFYSLLAVFCLIIPSLAAAQSSGGAPQQATNLQNPNISVIADLIGAFGNDPSLPERAFNVNEVELALQAPIDPYSRADVFISYSPVEEVVAVEEAYLTWLTMPAGLQSRVGAFRTTFGKFNQTHPHELGLADHPLAATNFLGEEGLSATGLELSWLVPTHGLYLKLVGEVSTTWQEAPAFGTVDTATGELLTPVNRDQLGYLGRAETFFEFSGSTSLSLGGSFATSENSPIEHLWTRLYGGDLVFRWKNPRRAVYRSVTWKTEALLSDREMPGGADNVQSVGAFSILDWQFAKRWHIGGRGDYSEFPENEGMNEKGGLAYFTFTPSEFSLVSLQGRYVTRPDGKKDTAGFIKLMLNMGPHGAHPF